MNKKKAVNGLLIGLSVLLVAGMAYQFTPNVGSLFNRQEGTPVIRVNGDAVTSEQLESARRGSALLADEPGSVLSDDAKVYLVSQAIERQAILGSVKDIQVSRADVNAEVQKVRESNQLTDNKAWTDALQSNGLTDAGFRTQVRQQLAYQRKTDELRKAVPAPTDAELRAYYDLNKTKYQAEPQIVGRQIVVSDKAKAQALLTQARGGADFAELARANSTENGDRGGALAPLDGTQPRPVLKAALPTAVGEAAFALTSGGLTDVIESGGKFYIVKVEKFVPGQPKTFEQAKTDLVAAVRQQKQDAALERWADEQRKNAKVEYVDPAWKIENPTVASVAGQNIPYSDVVAQVMNNQQIAGLVGQLPPEQLPELLNKTFKPQVVQQLIQGYAAPNIARKLGLSLSGSRQDIAQQLAAYGARDVKVSDADVQAYYRQNIAQYEVPASATLDEASFRDKNQAAAFRTDWNGQGDFVAAASKAGGTVSERGQVSPAPDQTTGEVPPLTAAAFGQNLRSVGEGSLTPVVQVGERYSVGYVRDLVRPTTRPLSEVSDEIRQNLLSSKQAETGQAFLDKQVSALNPKDNLEQVLAAQAKRVAASAPKTETPKTETPNTGTTESPKTTTTESAPATGTTTEEAPAKP
ncbi:peptidylprolyl isomerase [Deinococcus wulumuqiensis]|uniref:peptidylprolyl isomerase n=1 Tax=Deinococcus wulumuqiensis TaxID=980427 RepID=A0AAV4K7E8_9DEIO|nr:peptidylprolyl isomerase [Deinococcus wulumuqiensis]QII21248.1 peptidyl-prolyl cis-trans isomerase [Deinococcus wulumuqiensis R12]GGI92051.1 peptidylprolyl isomerase [Deinococcus wulumuqiensis]GGP31006.1 peptidylprolyl isomerase [Deinococcus wulumuqiensis]